MLFALILLALFLVLWLFFYVTGHALERLLARLSHRAAAFRYRDYLPVFIIVASGLGVTLVAGTAFEELAESVHEQSSMLAAFDTNVHDWAALSRSDGSTRLFVVMTLIGTPVGVGIMVTIIAAVLAIRGRWRWAAYLALTNGIGGLINLTLKGFFERARPELAEALRQASGYSFPSGHAMGSTIFFGTVAYLTIRSVRGWSKHAATMAAACTMAAAISASRIYLGVHWISDIAAGISAGLIWLLTATIAYETFRRIRRVRALRETEAIPPSAS